MVQRIAINGFGRIGRNVFRVIQGRRDMEVVSINDLTDAETLAHLLKYDSVHGRYPGKVRATKNAIHVDGRKVEVTAIKNPAELPHAENEIDFVVESTGVFRKREQCQLHLEAGAERVLLTVPPKDEIDAMIVMGVNEKDLRASHRIISNASCTTNCLAPAAKVLHEAFGIRHGLMTTVHAYTNDQRILDLEHGDLRRARAAAMNIIPTTTGAARAVGKVLPQLAGKLDGMAMRVPVPDGSVVDLVAKIARETTVEEVNAAFVAAARKPPLKGILVPTSDPIVSSDVIGNPASSIVDLAATMVIGDLVKIVTWYDNEWGYSNRVVDLMAFAMKKGRSRRKRAGKVGAVSKA